LGKQFGRRFSDKFSSVSDDLPVFSPKKSRKLFPFRVFSGADFSKIYKLYNRVKKYTFSTLSTGLCTFHRPNGAGFPPEKPPQATECRKNPADSPFFRPAGKKFCTGRVWKQWKAESFFDHKI
jgi:hypothetical protein